MSHLVCPRLPEGAALELLGEINRTLRKGGVASVREMVQTAHKAASPASTGRAITVQQLGQLRNRIVNGVTDAGTSRPADQRQFDLMLGEVLVRHLPFSVSDLSHGATWNFLTLCLLPDLLCRRFPDLSKDRALSNNRRRNILQRVWLRERALGEVIHRPEVQLSEDEFEQIMGRSSMVRIPGLPAMFAEELIATQSANRPEELARLMGKWIIRKTGAIVLDGLNTEQLRDVVRESAARAIAEFTTDDASLDLAG